MDPEERIRRREERRRRREAEKAAALEQETKESNIRSSREEAAHTSHDYEQTTPTLEPEKNNEPDSEQVPTENVLFVNDDDSRCNGDNEEYDNENVEQQKEDYTLMNRPDSDAEELTPSVTEENKERTENKVKVGKLSKISPPKPSPSQNSSQTEPEALNVYKEMKLKKEQDESMKTALLELRLEQTQIHEEIDYTVVLHEQ
ncbi:uncharacterized protein LOC117102890 [Anneissia japonica]|uniref:uncharacterized protein LOC117102890 n=1 Tax=Anneissia japonica TaxID=1529436 RepID=UPI001425B083|nr:uncharacterized protein LOC117102890 [Anneissia japonica]